MKYLKWLKYVEWKPLGRFYMKYIGMMKDNRNTRKDLSLRLASQPRILKRNAPLDPC